MKQITALLYREHVQLELAIDDADLELIYSYAYPPKDLYSLHYERISGCHYFISRGHINIFPVMNILSEAWKEFCE